MIKILFRYSFFILLVMPSFLSAQFITTTVASGITGKLGDCITRINPATGFPFGPPVATCQFLAGPGSNVNGSGALVITDPCDTTQVEITLLNVRWNNGAPDINWLHSVYFPASAGFFFQQALLPLPPVLPTASGWVFMPGGCTGVGSGCQNNNGMCNPVDGNAGTVGGAGWYYRNITGTSGGAGCCPGGAGTPSPCDNWGDGSLGCGTEFPIKFRARICNNVMTTNQYTLKIRFDMDGNTGCWGCQNLSARSEIVFSLATVPFTLPLFSPLPTATPPLKTCTPTLTFRDTLKGGCGNGNIITWWTAATGGIQVGSGSPFVYSGPVCAGGTTLYAACCPVGITCNNRRAFSIPNSCPPPFLINNVTVTPPSCTNTCGSIDAINLSGAIGPVTYTLMPGNITNSSGVFSCLTGTSYTVTATDSVGCQATGGASFIPPVCGFPNTAPISYCLNDPAIPLTAILTGAGTNLLWYTTLTGGVGSSIAPTPNTTILGPTTYYVTQSNAGVESTPRTPLVVTVNARPLIPTITSAVPTCALNGTSTVSNYSAVNTYTFTPAGPTVGVGGLITGMVIGTSYTVTASIGICASLPSVSFSNAATLITPAVPTITSVAPTCVVSGASTISNYSIANTYTFTPVGPTATGTGLITGMVIGTSYTVTSGNATCTSVSSASFSNAATLVTPAIPTITSAVPTCALNGTSMVSNYSAANTYTFTPAGPTVGAGGIITVMVIGTSYTVTSGNATCTSLPSVSFSNAATLITPAVPTITSVAPTCFVPGTSTISNYSIANTYTFTPVGPTATGTGLITGMVIGTSYTVTSGNATCTSLSSAIFSNAATLITPAVPTITPAAPTCLADGTSTISNYSAANTYTFTPTGPTATATGLITGMTIGTSYTVTSGLGICTSLPSASFSNAAILVTPAVPTITSVPPTCAVPGTSAISNYSAANTYTFTPAGPIATATGLITGMTIGTSYTVTSTLGICVSAASLSFSNAATLTTPAVPTITSAVPTCAVNGTSTISNYSAANTYTFTPTGPTATATGLITGMTIGTSYTVTSSLGICTSLSSLSFSNATILITPAIPTIASVAPTCVVPGTSTISNYNAANTYTFTPVGPTATGTGLITGMVIGTSYTVTSGNATCTSLPSASFSNAATLLTPAVPTITSAVPTCAANGTSTISNYNAANTYTFTPTGPTATATGLVTGMTIGTSYIVTSSLGICTSLPSVSFSNAAILVTPAIPTIASVAPTCLVPGTSTISNYSAANTYTFTPAGPIATATGLITGMTIGTSYTITSTSGTCVSAASLSFSNAATLITPAVPTITSAIPTCASNGTSIISNYNAANTYTFTPTGPTATGTGLVTGMTIGTSYTVTSGLGICTSLPSASFSNAAILVTPAVPTIVSVAPTCVVPGTSTISNYSAANTYTFTPAGPIATATGLITGMAIGASYTVTSGNATCTSVASTPFSNAATLITPAIPTITSAVPTCASNGTSAISNYSASNTYTFTPTGPTATATGLITGMTIGTSYTVTSSLGICTSLPSVSFSNAAILITPAVPTITSVAPTCVVPGTSTISNYSAANTYTFTPAGPIATATGLITGMAIGASYTVTSGNATCTSVASTPFSNAATLITPAIPTITSAVPTCASNGTSAISNYSASNTYTFTPTGPTATATGLITGMTIGTSYTITSSLGICTSLASLPFSNAAILVTPAVPTITSVAPTCVVPGTSTISNYNAANTYTFTPVGPIATATGLITGMTIGISYTVTSGNATCTSLPSASFSNAATLITPAVPTITSALPTCAVNGTSTISNYSAANTYTFTPTGPTATATGLIIGMTIGTSYTVTSGLGICTSLPSVSFSNAAMIVSPAAPLVTSAIAYCQNAPTTALTATGTNLLWYTVPVGGTSSNIAPVPSSTIAGVTTYYVSQTALTCEGPRVAIAVTITATPLLPTVNSPINYCPGDPSTQLSAIGTNLLWYTVPLGGSGSTIAPTPSTAIPGTFTFYVSQSTNVSPSLSCEGPRAVITVNVNNNNLTVNIGKDTTICEGESVKFSPTVNPTPPTIIYQWRAIGVPNSTIDNRAIKDIAVNPVDNAQYILNATIGGCATEDTVNVNVRWKPILDVEPSKAICLLDSTLIKSTVTHFNSTFISTFIDFTWTSTDSLRSPNTQQTWVYPIKSTWYKLTATTTKINYGCDFTVSDSIKIIVQPIVKAFAGNDTIAVKDIPHQLYGKGGINYEWSSPSGARISNPIVQNPFATLNNDANFYLKVTDAIGCAGYDSIFIKVYNGPTYYVPNAFSPNGDGLNDIFRVIPVGISNTVYFRVFNRFGEVVFETNQWLKGWDGTFKGKPQPSGAYVWMVSGTDRNYKKVEMKGTVMVVR
jgi:gliding motility-associated-like protein